MSHAHLLHAPLELVCYYLEVLELTRHRLIVCTLQFLDFEFFAVVSLLFIAGLRRTQGWLYRRYVNVAASFFPAVLAAFASGNMRANLANLLCFLWLAKQGLRHRHAMNGRLFRSVDEKLLRGTATLLRIFHSSDVRISVLHRVLLFVTYSVYVVLHSGSLLLATDNLTDLLIRLPANQFLRRIINIGVVLSSQNVGLRGINDLTVRRCGGRIGHCWICWLR